jgi:uncharacterized membrane protein YgdD (TMEM256/DUF423 family)
VDTVRGFGGLLGKSFGGEAEPLIVKPIVPVVEKSKGVLNIMFGETSGWIRLAGISGAIAVGMGAYGAHGLKNVTPEQRAVFETANRYHFIHTLALLAVPMTNRPETVGILLLLGIAVFSGTCYAHGITGDDKIIRFTPYGGMALIFAWLAMIV